MRKFEIAADQDPVIRTERVAKVYETGAQPVRAVDDVSIAVRRGEFVALVGPSGSGKTSLLAILAGLLQPSSGKLWVDGQEMAAMGDKARTRFRREKIGFTFQANNLLPYLTALENTELMLRLNGSAGQPLRETARDLLVRLGLEDRLHALPAQLSGGQQQRVAIARALVHNPSLVLADEPTASLDTERAHQVVRTFADLIHEQGRAGIMVTHDLRMVRYVDRVFQMVDGRLAGILSGREEILALAGSGISAPPPGEKTVPPIKATFNLGLAPAAAGD